MQLHVESHLDEERLKVLVGTAMLQYNQLRCSTEVDKRRQVANNLVETVKQLKAGGWQISFHNTYDLIHVFPNDNIEILKPDPVTGCLGLSSIPATEFLEHAIHHITTHKNPFHQTPGNQAAATLLNSLVGGEKSNAATM